METPSPNVFVEPPIPVATEFRTVEHVRSVIAQLDQGIFRVPALLVERMLWNPRLRAVLETRLAGLISTEIDFEPARNNRDARRVAKELKEDWPLMMAAPMRRQFWKWALLLGVSFGQRVLDTSPLSGRQILKLRPYWPGFASWYWAEGAYRIQTFDRGVTSTPSPSVDKKPIDSLAKSPSLFPAPSLEETPWIIAEAFGMNSWRDALVHAVWRAWLGHDFSMRDQGRASEKHGLGILLADYPRGSGKEHKEALAKYLHGLRHINSEAVVPLENRTNTADGDQGKFDVRALEFNGSGFQAISDSQNACAVALAILLLGHNLTTEIKGGGSYAAAGVADYIRDDKKYEDGSGEWAYAGPQIIQPWAMLNYGDPSLVPIARYKTDSPAVNKARAEMIQFLAQAIQPLQAVGVDVEALCEEFRLPLLAEAARKKLVQVPAANDNAVPSSPATQPAQPAAAIAELQAIIAEADRFRARFPKAAASVVEDFVEKSEFAERWPHVALHILEEYRAEAA